ncbi:DEAD/DEAH box helicase family protein [Candidatus Spongiihabitans sp.]|uniref:DEAD/DEAH box helicase family protein n=1 Tax=Candidatus Spongiihabitans sp. TaxID=3101308 RepID=UPI003C6FF3B5
MNEPMLHEKLTTGAEFLGGSDYYQQNIPGCIVGNLNLAFELRPYQLEAFGRFKYYIESYTIRPKSAPVQTLFHMATGSGKTLIMAGLMLYLYNQGYRNFLFFVNSTNIINKTRDNFLNTIATKYLFNESVQINNQQIRIKEVDTFQAANPDDTNIVFSTIQGLHARLNTPRENSITFDDFESGKIVLISDEAHHINAETKRAKDLNQSEMFDLTSWESTVSKIFKANTENILLEFTATIDLTNEQIVEKYRDKIIFDYPLKAFRLDGYSKEVKVLQSDIQLFDRALQAILLNQFRRKIFEKHGWFIKPVILLKSKTIKESNAFYDEFTAKIKGLKGNDLVKIKSNPNLDSVLSGVFRYFEENQITLENLALELQEEFAENKCISVNSKDESEQKQIAVNTLEDRDNEYRVIFAVDKLNEGWDVLNLFDIVRLYDTRDARANRPGKTTISEAQLIGRGARYCPFRLEDDQSLYQRKYDVLGNENEHELKLCEELYYHSAYNPNYIQELHMALEEIGIKAKESQQLSLFLKADFKKKPFYKSGSVFKNERVKYAREDVTGISTSFIETTHKFPLLSGFSQSSTVFESKSGLRVNNKQKNYFIKSFGSSIIKKALSQFPEYRFSNLKRLFPYLKSLSEFIQSDHYLGKIKVEVKGSDDVVSHLTQENKLDVVIRLLNKLSSQLQAENVDYKGTKEFKPYSVKELFIDKTLNIVNDGNSDKEYGIAQSKTTKPDLNMDLSGEDWFVFNENYGTTEEKYFVRYIAKVVEQLKQRYSQVYLLRNERHLKLFNFDDGRVFEPDFVLVLIGKNKPALHCQVFIEPKGSHLIKYDEWKNNFLMQLQAEHKVEQLWKDRNCIIWGMPFYNETETKPEFEKEFSALLQ